LFKLISLIFGQNFYKKLSNRKPLIPAVAAGGVVLAVVFTDVVVASTVVGTVVFMLVGICVVVVGGQKAVPVTVLVMRNININKHNLLYESIGLSSTDLVCNIIEQQPCMHAVYSSRELQQAHRMGRINTMTAVA
jgi:hypothetical protein